MDQLQHEIGVIIPTKSNRTQSKTQ